MAGEGQISVSGGGHWKAALEALAKAGATLSVGVQGGATNDYGDSVAAYAFWNEYGAPGTPARPFMRQTLDARTATWSRGFSNLLKGCGTDPGLVREALSTLGDKMVADIQKTIEHGNFQPNSPATLARKNPATKKKPGGDKGRNRPLIDTSAMHDSISAKLDGEQ